MDKYTDIQDIQQPEDETVRPSPKRIWAVAAVILGCVAAIAGWGALMFLPGLSLAAAAAGVALCIAGLWSGRGCLRDLDITALIASAVLLFVHLIFIFALDYALDSL